MPYPLPPRRAHEVPWGAQRGAEGGEELDGDGGRRVGWAYMAKSRSPTGEPGADEERHAMKCVSPDQVRPSAEDIPDMHGEAMAEKKSNRKRKRKTMKAKRLRKAAKLEAGKLEAAKLEAAKSDCAEEPKTAKST